MAISYDVEPDEHEVRAIPPQEIHIPKPPKSLTQGGQPGQLEKMVADMATVGVNPFERFGAILYREWVAHHEDANIIIGYWAEDDSPYEITVPHQLRSTILKLQNTLCKKYNAVKELQQKLDEMKKNFSSMFN
jgi:hypothetical protein